MLLNPQLHLSSIIDPSSYYFSFVRSVETITLLLLSTNGLSHTLIRATAESPGKFLVSNILLNMIDEMIDHYRKGWLAYGVNLNLN
jgi:uncharacterized membrane protein